MYRRDYLLTPSDWTFAKPKELLFYLLCHPPRTKEQIGLVFWPDASPAQLRSSFRAALYHLRRALGGTDWIVFQDGRYAFNRALNYWFDVEQFERLLFEARQREPAAPADIAPLLEEARQLYQGDLLDEFAHCIWCEPLRESLRQQHLEAMLRLGRLYLDNAQYRRAADLYRQLIISDEFLEKAHRGLMRSYARLGQRSQALRHYRSLVQLFDRELGVAPERETTRLFERLSRGEE